jgi:apolipoprotein N-acyltransferase
LICFESAFPEYIREALLKGAEFLVNITNDTWFGRSPGPFQHMRIAVFRAIENRVWIARCANSGISALIDPYGKETARAGLYERKVVTGNIAPLDEYTVFTLHGPVIGKVSLYLSALIIVTLAIAHKRKLLSVRFCRKRAISQSK